MYTQTVNNAVHIKNIVINVKKGLLIDIFMLHEIIVLVIIRVSGQLLQ